MKCQAYFLKKKLRKIFQNVICKAVGGGPAGPESARPFFWPNMLSTIPHFYFFFTSAFSVMLICDIV